MRCAMGRCGRSACGVDDGFGLVFVSVGKAMTVMV